jgi:hypothetical protein
MHFELLIEHCYLASSRTEYTSVRGIRRVGLELRRFCRVRLIQDIERRFAWRQPKYLVVEVGREIE